MPWHLRMLIWARLNGRRGSDPRICAKGPLVRFISETQLGDETH